MTISKNNPLCISLVFIIVFLLLGSCKKQDNISTDDKINPHLKILINRTSHGPANIVSAVWLSNNLIYTSSPFAFCSLSADYEPGDL
ncbi:MAG TPA: hypothetical protein VFM18_14765, partial [Methanosarcina sp.]|nr:hypothetical protein [Methanosarcina sp.]